MATAAKDTRGDYYSNVAEFGPGLRLAVPRLSSLQFHVEFLHGVCLGRGHRTRNPCRPNFTDVRLFFVYGKSF